MAVLQRHIEHFLFGRTYLAASVLPGGRVFISGGMEGGDVVASTEIYDLATGRVVFGPNLTQFAESLGIFALGESGAARSGRPRVCSRLVRRAPVVSHSAAYAPFARMAP